VVFTVTLDKVNNTGSPITFNIAQTAGTAISGTDYTALPATISVADGSATGSVSRAVTNDALLESDETVTATISASSNPDVSITTAAATATIIDNETATASITKTQDGNEAGTVSVIFTVALDKTNNTGAGITFDLAMTGTATNGTDYSTAPTTVTIPNGSINATVTLTVVDDALLENAETVIATISNPTNPDVTSISPDNATASIAESGATINIVVQQHGSETGPTSIIYRVELRYNAAAKTNVTGSAITVDYADVTPVAIGKATSGLDYNAFGGTATIANTQSSTTFTVTVIDDIVPAEGTETVDAQISNLTGPGTVTLGTTTATANITDN
jgi:hypothetical protein